MMQKIDSKVEALLFARWIASSYADEHIDKSMRSQHTLGFQSQEAISVLNIESGNWWKKQVKYFYKEVLPEYKKNGSYKNARDFIQHSICSKCGAVVFIPTNQDYGICTCGELVF